MANEIKTTNSENTVNSANSVNSANTAVTVPVNRMYKSTLFIMLFQDKKNLLELSTPWKTRSI